MTVRDGVAVAAVVLALLAFLPEAAYAGPPERPDGRLTLDPIPELRAEVLRCEQEYARDKTDRYGAERLAEARARLAEAEGRLADAADEWWKVVANRQKRMKNALSRGSDVEVMICEGQLAEARCRLSEIESDWSLLASELQALVDCCKARLDMYSDGGGVGPLGPNAAKDYKLVSEALRNAERRLELIKKKLGPP